VQDDLFDIDNYLILRHVRISFIQIYLLSVAFGLGIFIIADSYNPAYVLATAGPTSNTITAKLTDSLKSITSNISTSVQDTLDEVIADSMDILIDNTMSKLGNATIYDNSDTSNVKFEPKVPSGIDMSQSSN
jgi:hypothetical protein